MMATRAVMWCSYFSSVSVCEAADLLRLLLLLPHEVHRRDRFAVQIAEGVKFLRLTMPSSGIR